ncbi:hypothetical protein NE595_15725 [Coprococcus sp. DFI.6.81]|uniref:DUF6674 family protein n=1 Tax=Bacillota TaxID=1239 RepID=UPI0008213077|nr:DUF6674 family protein [Coprococcus sp. DFI.6.81]MCQ5034493.1 hypothetical protein [Coprococcus sp. DFI.6.81]SCI51416.1 Uncharacterised protein [uncultured Clostridium sp.]
MSRKSKARLAENSYVKELLTVLKENPSPSSQDFMEMVAHVGELENRLAEAVDELKTMRQELQKVQSRSLKAVLQRSCKALESNISSMRQRLSELKDHIVTGCKNALAAFKEHGTVALDGIGRFFHVKPMLESMKKAVNNSINVDNKAIDKIQAFSAEYHQAGRHLKNMGRTLIGKEPIQEVKAPGKIVKVISAPYKADRACMMAAKRNIEKALENLDRLQESAQRRPSVLKAMRENGEKLQPPVQNAAPAKAADKAEL